jgi:predicted Zn-dependent protease
MEIFNIKKSVALWMAFWLIAGALCPSPAHAMTIKEEEDLSVEFMKAVRQMYVIIEDPFIQNYINQVGQKIVSSFPSQPFAYHFYVVRQDSFNAFAGPAGHVFIHSGLFEALDNEDELAGLLAHEITHVYCRHISDIIAKSQKTSMATLAGVAAGILMGLGGVPAVGQAVTIGSMAAGQTAVLAYTRENEVQADQVGRTYLEKSGYDLSALRSVLKKIRAVEWYDSKEIPTYLKTHPATEDRIIYLDTLLENHKKTTLQPSDDFLRAKYRLIAFYGNRENALQKFQAVMDQDPNNMMARYAYGLTLERSGNPKAAIPFLQAVYAAKPNDPYMTNDLGRAYFLSGDYENAVRMLNNPGSLKSGGSDGYLYLGQSQMELGKNQEAADTFTQLLTYYPDNREVHYFLGKTLGAIGKLGQAHYHLGIFYFERNDFRTAMFHLRKALELETSQSQKAKIEEVIAEIKKQEAKDWRPDTRG